ncbi:MAG: amidohydrolase family protein, partial [Clostridia bacterium]|nr:amidohydrolase family protein [Clostridia bacterium]
YYAISAECAKHGATTIVPTVTSSTYEKMQSAVATYKKMKNKVNGANIAGLHFEGPYFALSQKGAQDEKYIKNFDKAEYEEIIKSTDCILRWTAAPELDGSKEFAKFLKQHNILPCIGHSDADCDCASEAFYNGFTHVTHLYSCTSGVHRKNGYRYGGIIEAAYLIDNMTVEIIADGIHLPPELLKLIYKIKGAKNIALVTDSMRGAGMPDGPSILGGLEDGLHVIIEDGVAKLPSKDAFAGSVAFCDRLVKNMIRLANVSMPDAIMMASTSPANIMGFSSKGKIKKGYDADIVIFDDNINVLHSMVGGKTVYNQY